MAKGIPVGAVPRGLTVKLTVQGILLGLMNLRAVAEVLVVLPSRLAMTPPKLNRRSERPNSMSRGLKGSRAGVMCTSSKMEGTLSAMMPAAPNPEN